MKITLRQKLSSLKLGDHACFSIKNRQEQIAVTSAFLQIGLERNERCLFLGDPVLVADVTSALVGEGVNVHQEVSREALLLQSNRDYLVNGQFESKTMVRCLLKVTDDALKAGFHGLRATGDVIWELGTSLDLRTLLEYEPALDAAFQGKQLLGLCQYREDSFSPKYLRNMLFTHPKVVVDEKVYSSNPYHNCVKSFDELDYHSLPLEKMYATLK